MTVLDFEVSPSANLYESLTWACDTWAIPATRTTDEKTTRPIIEDLRVGRQIGSVSTHQDADNPAP